MWEKIETFLFDLIGLLLPGIVFIAGIILTSLFLLPEASYSKFANISKEIPLITILFTTLENIKGQKLLIVLLFLLHAYLVGHVIKVFSKVFYSFFTIVFDEGLNNLFLLIKSKLKISTNSLKPGFIKSILKFFSNAIKEIFVFKPQDYEKPNKQFLTESMTIINRKFNTNFPDEWYSFYKLAKIVIAHENLKSMNETFLAKYNLYRSLSFITFIQILVIIFLTVSEIELNIYASEISFVLLILNFIFWYTFHEKYKRYYRLCGNEVLVAIYYHFKKDALSQIEEN